MAPRIYLITYHRFNHEPSPAYPNAQPLDSRFLSENSRYTYYLIDKEVPPVLQSKPVILESTLSSTLYEAGGKYLGEWSFLLNEEKFGFCQYPFFMISSRFYQKNRWLHRSLNEEWDQLFAYLNQYGWGYLPSYDRPLRWIDLSWKEHVERQIWKYRFFPYTEHTYKLTEEIFGVNIPRDYRYTADFFCNYIGFKSRAELLAYVAFYRPLLDYFFDSEYRPKRDISKYVRTHGGFRNEKPFTFFLELLCHLFFFKNNHPYFALHYNGYYSIDERNHKLHCIERFPISRVKKGERFFKWQIRKLKTESIFARYLPLLRRLKAKFKSYVGRDKKAST